MIHIEFPLDTAEEKAIMVIELGSNTTNELSSSVRKSDGRIDEDIWLDFYRQEFF